MKSLRPWQEKALKKALHWLVEVGEDRHFLINAAPGSGKTIAASVIAKSLIDMGLVDRVVVIAPRVEVVNQWGRDFKATTERFMGKVTSSEHQIEYDVCATWAAVEGLQDAFQAVCRDSRVLVICDEHHHAAVEAAWGSSADSAFADARYVLILTGTPIRSDRKESVWLAYDDQGTIDHPEGGTYTLTYGEAVDLGYCRPSRASSPPS
jgi:superfamily II DNA or RNA helicase